MRISAFILVILLLLCSVSGALAAEDGEDYIHISSMQVRFSGTDATVDLFYDLDFFGDMYVFALGSRHLKPEFEGFFYDFEEFKVLEIGRSHSRFLLKNVSRESENFYLHDEKKLGRQVGSLVVIYPAGPSKAMGSVDSIPNLFYEKQ
ncbi:hypothetical protein [Methanohalophilus sp.]